MQWALGSFLLHPTLDQLGQLWSSKSRYVQLPPGGVFLMGAPFSQMPLACVKVTLKRVIAMSFLLPVYQSKQITGLAQMSKKGERPHLLGWRVLKLSVENAHGRLAAVSPGASISFLVQHTNLFSITRGAEIGAHSIFVMFPPPSMPAAKSHEHKNPRVTTNYVHGENSQFSEQEMTIRYSPDTQHTGQTS